MAIYAAGGAHDALAFVPASVNSSSLITVGAVVADDTFTLGGVVFTAKASPAAVGEYLLGANSAATAQNLLNAINATGSPASASWVADRLSAATFYANYTKVGVGIAAITASAHITIAQAAVGSGIGDSPALRTAQRGVVVWDSGSVAAGAVIDSPIIDVTGLATLYVVVDNSGGANTRNLTMDTFLDDGTTLIDTAFAIRTVSITTKERGVIGQGAAAAGTPALTFFFPIALPTKIKLHLVAAGAAAGRVTVFGR